MPGSNAPVLVDQSQVAGLHVVLSHFEAARGVQNGHLDGKGSGDGQKHRKVTGKSRGKAMEQLWKI